MFPKGPFPMCEKTPISGIITRFWFPLGLNLPLANEFAMCVRELEVRLICDRLRCATTPAEARLSPGVDLSNSNSTPLTSPTLCKKGTRSAVNSRTDVDDVLLAGIQLADGLARARVFNALSRVLRRTSHISATHPPHHHFQFRQLRSEFSRNCKGQK